MLLDLVTFPLVVSLILTLLWRSLNFLCPIQQYMYLTVKWKAHLRSVSLLQYSYTTTTSMHITLFSLRENHAWHCFTTVSFMISSLLFGSCILLDRLWFSECKGCVNRLTRRVLIMNKISTSSPIQC